MNLILCGFQNCGKTTIAAAFAKAYDYHLIDTDDLVCQQYNDKNKSQYSVREIHQQLGESLFREAEKAAISSIPYQPKTIIATGGGVLTQPENVQHLRTLGKIIYLHVDTETLLARMLQQDTLPNFVRADAIAEDFAAYIKSRETLYSTLADHEVNITDKTVDECVLLLNILLS